jgi:hypothetical protein
MDHFGDGMCCGDGSDGFDGSYELVLEGEKIHKGAEFGQEDVFKFTPGGEGGDDGGDDPIGDDPTMPPEEDDPNTPPEGDDESAKCECVGNSDSMGSEVCTAFVTEYSCDLASYDCSWKCDDGDDDGEDGDDFATPSKAPTAAASDAPTAKPSDAPTAKPSHAPTAKPEEDDETPTMKVSTVYNAKAHKKVGKIAIFSWEAEPVNSEEDYEPETYAGNFRIETRNGKNAEYETLTEQVVTEGTDGKYYFVMPEAACKKKVQVRITGLGPDGGETAAKASQLKKLKC